MALLTYEYRLYPRKGEITLLEQMLAQAREVYNRALQQCKAVYEVRGQHETGLEQWPYFREWRKQAGSLLNASSLQHLLRRLDKAYGAFFRRIADGETPGHPRFKGRDQFKSVEYTYGDGCKLHFEAGKKYPALYVQNIGNLKVKFHRDLPPGAIIKHVIIKRKASGWYVYLQLEPKTLLAPPNGKPAVGVDMGVLRLLTLSDGTQIDNPHWLREALADLRVAQRRLSWRVKGSNGRCEARQRLAKLHEHIANIRKDFWHRTTCTLVHTYGLIGLENLTLAFITRNPYLALSAHDAALGAFKQVLTYKAEKAGCQVVFVNAAYTSQDCSQCGARVEKDLSVRVHDCPQCGLHLDRDLNAAVNIKNKALKSAWTEPSGVNVDPLPQGKVKRSLRCPCL